MTSPFYFADVSVDKFPAARQEMTSRTGRATVPQIFFNAHHVGGNDDLQKLVTFASALVTAGFPYFRFLSFPVYYYYTSCFDSCSKGNIESSMSAFVGAACAFVHFRACAPQTQSV